MPILNAMLFCDEAVEDRATGKFTLRGVFTKSTADSFPCWADFDLWLWMSGDEERGRLAVVCRKDGETAWFRRVFERDVDFLLNDELFIRFRARQFCFPRLGRYRFEVLFDGKIIGEQRLLLFDQK
jgi:hypothetical protein